MKMQKFLLSLLFLLPVGLGACKQELPARLDEPNVFGTVQEVKTVERERMLIYQGGEDPYQKNWGFATAYMVRVDDVWYPVHWNEAEKFKTLQVGDKVNLHPGEYIACVGEKDLRPECHRMMRVYKSSRRINPLITK